MRDNKEHSRELSGSHHSPVQISFYGYATLSPFQLRLYLLKRLVRIFFR
ncbi:hypothetical protein SAMN05216522_104133 [Rosenbergiella nectarea]|uniref:Uncharacterized protein n=1 Tax=Rosenbergiella nectarea TaxID=988801 RepID=A0A1H9H9S7_9GAMM|nr:hypothetical protein SAMN05216522_104133 [Rosenbergiella nectarea]